MLKWHYKAKLNFHAFGNSIKPWHLNDSMFSFDKIQEGMVKSYAQNTKKFYEHLESCDECQTKLAKMWKHAFE